MLEKILLKANLKDDNLIWINELSSASKSLNIYKNKQNSKYIKASFINPFERSEIEFIKKFLKEGKVDIRHLNDIKGAFLSCDEDK